MDGFGSPPATLIDFQSAVETLSRTVIPVSSSISGANWASKVCTKISIASGCSLATARQSSSMSASAYVAKKNYQDLQDVFQQQSHTLPIDSY